MDRSAIKDLLDKLQPAVEKARRAAQQAKEAENETSKSAATSWSAAGEREYTHQQAKIASDNLVNLENLLNEVTEAVGQPAPMMVRPVSMVTVMYVDSQKTDTFYFVSKSLYLIGARLISPESPIGQAVEHKSVGEEFEYEVESKKVRGIVKLIE